MHETSARVDLRRRATGRTTVASIMTGAAALALAILLPACSNPLVEAAKFQQTAAASPIIALAKEGGGALPDGGNLEFGTVGNGASRELVVTVTNSGKTALVFPQGAFVITPYAGTEAGAFSLPEAPAGTVASGDRGSFSLRLLSSSAGQKSARLEISSNDATRPKYLLELSATVSDMLGVAAPIFSHASTTYQSDQSVSLANATAGASIYVTTGDDAGSEPSDPDPANPAQLYAEGTGIAVAGSGTKMVIKALATKTGMVASPVVKVTIQIGAQPPTLSTKALAWASEASASGGGSVLANGGSPVTARGICWSTSPSPTTGDSVAASGSGNGDFSSTMTGILPGTTYYVRAYATNAAGTGYGNQASYILPKIGFFPNDAQATGSMAEQTVPSGVTGKLANCGFAKTGWSFAGWATSGSGPVAFANGADWTAADANLNLYAKWSANSYRVIFHANGGTGTMADQSVSYGGQANLKANVFAYQGYIFSGWATSPGGAVAYGDGASYWTGAADQDLYAVWMSGTGIVSFNANGGAGSMLNLSLTNGASAYLTKNRFARTGYTFKGWHTNATAGGTPLYEDEASFTMGPASVVLYAIWAGNPYSMGFDANGGSGTMGSQTLVCGTATPLSPNTFSRTSYSFAGWSTEAGGTVAYADGASYTIGAGPATLFAQWIPIPVSGVALSASSLALAGIGATGALSATISPADALDKAVAWSSGAPDIASVDQSGKVTAVNPGRATITATTHDGNETASCAVSVAPAAPTGLSALPSRNRPAGDGRASITWAAPAGSGLAYDIYRSTVQGELGSRVNGGLVAATEYLDSGLSNWTTYYYSVKALRDGVESPASAQAAAMPTNLALNVTLHNTARVNTHRIDQSAWTSSPVASALVGAGPVNLAVDASGRFIYESNTAESLGNIGIFGYPLDQTDGRLGGSLAFDGRGSLYLAGQLLEGLAIASPGGPTSAQFLYASEPNVWNGSAWVYGNKVYGFLIDNATGNLSRTAQASVNVDANPRDLVVSPNGKFLYASATDSSRIDVYAIDAATGALTFMQFVDIYVPYRLAVSPDGKFLFASSFTTAALYSFAINQATGVLSLTDSSGVGSSPTAAAVDPSGRFLYVSNGGSNSVSRFAIAADGKLSGRTDYACDGYPNDLAVDPTGAMLAVACSTGAKVDVFSIDQATGALTRRTGADIALAAGSSPDALLFVKLP